jgi:protein-disulfide isomerase
MEKTLTADMAAAAKAGVTGTPAFFINGVMLSGAQGPEAFERIIDQELAGS